MPDFIVWGQDIHSVLTTGRHCHTHLCISLYTLMLSMGRLRRDRCNFVKWFSSVLELIIFKFLLKTPRKILLNILINASYIFFNKYFSWTEHQCCSNYFFTKLAWKRNSKCLYCIAFMISRFVISVPKLLKKM